MFRVRLFKAGFGVYIAKSKYSTERRTLVSIILLPFHISFYFWSNKFDWSEVRVPRFLFAFYFYIGKFIAEDAYVIWMGVQIGYRQIIDYKKILKYYE